MARVFKNRVCIFPAGHAGMALYTYKLANALSEKQMDVDLLVDDQYEFHQLATRFNKVSILSSGNLNRNSTRCRLSQLMGIVVAHVANWACLFQYLKKNTFEIVHIQPQFYPLDWIGVSILRKMVRVVITVHDVIPHKFFTNRFQWLEKWFLSIVFRGADTLIVHAEANRKLLLDYLPCVKSRTVMIPHGEYSLQESYSAREENEARADLGFSGREKIILFFGFIRRNKGLHVLLKAFEKVSKIDSHAVLVIAGSVMQGQGFEVYQDIIDKMKCRKRIHSFIAYVKHDDIPTFFLSSDIVVLPYLEFGSQSGVMHLAQGFGKPVVASAVGGLPEAIEDQKSGLLVPPGDVDGLAEAIEKLLDDEDLRKKMGDAAKRDSLTRFSWDNIAEKTIEEVYKNQRCS